MRIEFDRGTVVLRNALGDVDLASLPGLVFDPRIAAHRAPARFHPKIVELMRGQKKSFEDTARSNLERPLPFERPSLRPYQEASLSAWNAAGRRGVVVMPTGSGKTRMAIAAIADSGKSTLCIVPTRVLVEQWMTRCWLLEVLGFWTRESIDALIERYAGSKVRSVIVAFDPGRCCGNKDPPPELRAVAIRNRRIDARALVEIIGR